MSTIAEQQRATTEVLKLISSSFGDPQPVFASILASAVRLCDADNGIIRRWDGDALHLVATHNIPQAFIELREQLPLQAAPVLSQRPYAGDREACSHRRFGRGSGLH